MYALCSQASFPLGVAFSTEEFLKRVAKYEGVTEILQSLFATGCRWGAGEHLPLWIRSLKRVANPAQPMTSPYYEAWRGLIYYPSLLLLYAGGIAAVAAKKYETFAALLWRPIIRESRRGQDQPLVIVVNAQSLISGRDAQNFNPGQTFKTPTSDHLFSVLRPRFVELLPDDLEFQRAFDEFEYLLALTVVHYFQRTGGAMAYAPYGCFVWRDALSSDRLIYQIKRDAKALGHNWPPLKAGLFDQSIEAFESARDALHSSEIFRELEF